MPVESSLMLWKDLEALCMSLHVTPGARRRRFARLIDSPRGRPADASATTSTLIMDGRRARERA